MAGAWAIGLLLPCAAFAAPLAASPPPGTPAIAVTSPGGAPADLALRRAAAEQRLGHPRGVIAALERVDFSAAPVFAGGDRAAFLLGEAYLATGDLARFGALAAQVGQWAEPTAFTRWLVAQDALLRAARGDSSAAARLGSAPLAGWAAVLGARAAGSPDDAELEALSSADSSTRLGRDLAGSALLERARRVIEQGGDARALLEQVPSDSRASAAARHLLGQLNLETGETQRGEAELSQVLASNPGYDSRRDVMLALGAQAVAAADWDSAWSAFARAGDDWDQSRAALRGMLASGGFAPLWHAWTANPASGAALALDAAPFSARAAELAAAAADLGALPELSLPAADVAPADATVANLAPSPSAAEWTDLALADRRAAQARDALGRARADADSARFAMAEQAVYLGTGLAGVRAEAGLLAARSATLDSLRRRSDELDARLKQVRDAWTARIQERARAIQQLQADQDVWLGAQRHFYVEGPARERPLEVPPGLPRPESVLLAEGSLGRSLADAAGRIGGQAPALLARSYEQAWGPRLVDRLAVLDDSASALLHTARRLDRAIDSALAMSQARRRLLGLEARVATLARRADSLGTAGQAARDRVARRAATRALAALEGEREAIDYGLAAAAYGACVHLGHADSSDVAAVGSRADTLGQDEPAGTTALRDRAIANLRAFLERHPHSPARGEMRFRLADALMLQSRQEFRQRMAAYLRASANGSSAPGAVPVPGIGPSLALYRDILSGDPDFPHLDAVLFNAGTLLADEADPRATDDFRQLVSRYPDSPYCQEAWLRMGDSGFNDRRYEACIPLYERAASGPDTTLRAIALYKLGWSRFSLDRFLEAADAFRGILDLDSTGTRVGSRVNLQDEAEAYFVHTIARAGGAPAFARYFDSIGGRPYELRLLRALGQHLRRYSLYAQAADADRLLIQRHPLHPDALLAAERMVETYHRWDRDALERAARLEVAPRFAPGTEWAAAQSSDSVRAEGELFARGSLTAVARAYHRDARDHGRAADWRRALELYEDVLGRWPGDAQAPLLELQAGEAAAAVGEPSRALEHYAAAARTGDDSLAAQALWQRVAVTDAWYESRRAAHADAGERDSLAHAVLARADELLARFPAHARAADLMWRAGQLSIAHGWFDRATLDFARMVERRPADPRTPQAARLRADALVRLERFDDAGEAFATALDIARRTGVDSLARYAEHAIPVCAYRAAEAAVAADSTDFEKHARLFDRVADRYPSFANADLARYRAALAWGRAGRPEEAVRSLESVVRDHPRSAYVRDALLRIGATHTAANAPAKAADAYERFAARFPADEQAANAWLKAADFYEAAGRAGHADTLRLDYIRRHPADVQTAMEVMEALARRELATVDGAHPVSSLLARRRAGHAAVAAPSRLAQYLALAAKHPRLASRDLPAQVRFLQGEEAAVACAAVPLRQPLARSIPARQKRLDAALVRYRECVNAGVPEWAGAATFRIGELLVAFGDALDHSERPADLHGDDLAAYEDVLRQQSRVFVERGEGVWTDLLRRRATQSPDDPWIGRARAALWQRLGERFAFRPETEYPLPGGWQLGRDTRAPAGSPKPAQPDTATGGKESDPQ